MTIAIAILLILSVHQLRHWPGIHWNKYELGESSKTFIDHKRELQENIKAEEKKNKTPQERIRKKESRGGKEQRR